MADETLQLLKAFIDAMGYEYKIDVVDPLVTPVEAIYKVTKKPKKLRETKQEGYSEGFLELWSIYSLKGKGSKQAAFRQYKARMAETTDKNYYHSHQQMKRGMHKYVFFIKETGQYSMHMSTFLGRDKHYLNDFTIPDSVVKKNRVKQDWETIPENENHILAFIEKHGFKKCTQGETTKHVINRLRSEIRARILAEEK